MNDNDAILDGALRAATTDILAHYGVSLTAIGQSPALSIDGHDAVGVIGFSGSGLRGTLVMATSTALVAKTCPDTDPRFPLRDRVRDWIGELSNLVLGRVKVALAQHGVAVGLSTPVAFTGEHLRLGAVQTDRTRAWDFTGPDGDMRVWLEVEFEQPLTLVRLPLAATPDGLEAGEPLFF